MAPEVCSYSVSLATNSGNSSINTFDDASLIGGRLLEAFLRGSLDEDRQIVAHRTSGIRVVFGTGDRLDVLPRPIGELLLKMFDDLLDGVLVAHVFRHVLSVACPGEQTETLGRDPVRSGIAGVRSHGNGGTMSDPDAPLGALRRIRTRTLDIGYHELGPGDGPMILLLHGYPYDVHTYIDAAPALAS